MVRIRGYIISVMCVSVVGSLVSMLAPDGEGGGLGKHIRLIFGLCVIIVSINPIKDIVYYIKDVKYEWDYVKDGYDSEKYEEIFYESYSASEIENLKSGIKQLLSDRFDIDISECEISVGTDGGGGLERILVTLYGNAVWKNTEEIEEYLYGLFGCEIVTAIG